MPTWLIVLIVVAAILLLLVAWFVIMYNGLVRRRNQVEESWHQVDVELTRRHDLVMNLVETVKGYAKHEVETFDRVMQARYQAMNAEGPSGKGKAEGELSQAMGRLFAVAEGYPELKANQNFLALQEELTSTEDRIASARRHYNAGVRDLNTSVRKFPTNTVANMFHIGKADYFEADEQERTAPKVDSGSATEEAPAPEARPAATPVRSDRPTGQMPPMRDADEVDPRA